MSKYNNDVMYNKDLTKKSFKKLLGDGRYWCTKREKAFLRELWDLYVLYSLPMKYSHEDDIKWCKSMRKACRQILESHLYTTELGVYNKIHEASKERNINDVLEAYLNDKF